MNKTKIVTSKENSGKCPCLSLLRRSANAQMIASGGTVRRGANRFSLPEGKTCS